MYVAGIDAHTTYLVVAVVSKQGELVCKPVRVPVCHPERLQGLLERYRPLEAVVETSPTWPWLYEQLTAQGVHFVLAHAKRLRAIAESKYKTDAVDAELLARMRLAGLIPEVFPQPREQREVAALVRHRAVLVRYRTALLNRIHAQLHAVGLGLARGRLRTQAARRWLREVAWPQLGPERRRVIRSHLQLLAAIQPLVRSVERRIRAVAAELPAVALVQTVPGIGPCRGLLLAAEVQPISRFPQPKHLVSYAGLAPRSRKSGLRPVRYGAIPAGANRWVRGALVRAVVCHVQHAPESWLSRYYAAQKQRLGWPTARVATARKLARALHAMLRTGEAWQDQRDVSMPRGELLSPHVAQTTTVL